jgi:hypothetical protein
MELTETGYQVYRPLLLAVPSYDTSTLNASSLRCGLPLRAFIGWFASHLITGM